METASTTWSCSGSSCCLRIRLVTVLSPIMMYDISGLVHEQKRCCAFIHSFIHYTLSNP